MCKEYVQQIAEKANKQTSINRGGSIATRMETC